MCFFFGGGGGPYDSNSFWLIVLFRLWFCVFISRNVLALNEICKRGFEYRNKLMTMGADNCVDNSIYNAKYPQGSPCFIVQPGAGKLVL